jgi:hypothetical protein
MAAPVIALPTRRAVIEPPTNSAVLYFGTVDLGDRLLLSFDHDEQRGERVALRFDGAWRTLDTTMVIELPAGWTIVPRDSALSWSSAGPIWIAQLLAPMINFVLQNAPLELRSELTLLELATGRRHDNAITVVKDS